MTREEAITKLGLASDIEKDLKVGQWIKTNINGQHQITCSCCDYTEPEYRSFIRNFCPNCGVYMVEELEKVAGEVKICHL